jgi:hypothetical protein
VHLQRTTAGDLVVRSKAYEVLTVGGGMADAGVQIAPKFAKIAPRRCCHDSSLMASRAA